jgi:hypothetical protein
MKGNPWSITTVTYSPLSSKFFQWVTYSVSRRSVSSNPNEAVLENPLNMFSEDELAFLRGLSQ